MFLRVLKALISAENTATSGNGFARVPLRGDQLGVSLEVVGCGLECIGKGRTLVFCFHALVWKFPISAYCIQTFVL